MPRILYVIAYDISDERRLAEVRDFLKGYSTGGQKSVYECFLTENELKVVASTLRKSIQENEDRVHIFRLDGRSRVHTLGIACEPKDPSYFYIG